MQAHHPIVPSLHWLSVHFRIQFKTRLIAFKALNGPGPILYHRPYSLALGPIGLFRSDNKSLLYVPWSRCLAVVSTQLWKQLPRCFPSISDYKPGLQTNFNSLAFLANKSITVSVALSAVLHCHFFFCFGLYILISPCSIQWK